MSVSVRDARPEDAERIAEVARELDNPPSQRVMGKAGMRSDGTQVAYDRELVRYASHAS